MKMTKDDLKALIKECLVEVLNDGIGSSISTRRPQTEVRTQKQPSRSPDRRFDPRLDTPVALKEAIKKEAGGNRLMESIFSDTARTTMKEQASYGDSGPGGSTGGAMIAQQEQFRGSPEEVFGEDTASNWAALAFGPSGPNKLQPSHT